MLGIGVGEKNQDGDIVNSIHVFKEWDVDNSESSLTVVLTETREFIHNNNIKHRHKRNCNRRDFYNIWHTKKVVAV
jgi:hypothetical protein